MAEEELHFGVTLDDHMSGPAKEAGKSLHELAGHAEHGKGLIDELAHGFIRAVEPAEVLKDAFKEVGGGLREMMSGLKSGEAKEVVSGLAESIGGLASMLDLVVPGLGQVASAAIKAGGAFLSFAVGIAQAGAELAIEASFMKGSLIDTFDALGGGNGVGKETEEMLAGLSHQIGVTRDTLAPFTKSFMAMGIEGEAALKKVTLAAISAQAIMSDPSAAHSFETLTKKIQVAVQTGQGLKIPAKGLGSLADMGIRVDDVAKRMNVSTHTLAAQLKAGTVNAAAFGDALQDALIEKGQKPLARLGSSVANIRKMFGQSIDEMFEDMSKSTEPFLGKIREALTIFDQSTESGRDMKLAVTTAFTTIFDVASKAIVPIEHFFLRSMILSVKTYTLIKRHWTEIRTVFAGVQPVISGVAKSFDIIAHAVEKLEGIDQAITNATTGVGQMARPIGKNFSAGLADGIRDGAGDVKDAAHGAAKDAVNAANKGLDNHSPSRLMFKAGGHATAGLALGMRANAPMVAHASRAVATSSVRTVGASIRASDYTARRGDVGRVRQGGGSSASVQGGIHIAITAPNGVTGAQELTEIGVATLFERLQLMAGR